MARSSRYQSGVNHLLYHAVVTRDVAYTAGAQQIQTRVAHMRPECQIKLCVDPQRYQCGVHALSL